MNRCFSTALRALAFSLVGVASAGTALVALAGDAHAQFRIYPSRLGTCSAKAAYAIIRMPAGQCRAIGGAMNGSPADDVVSDCHLDWCREDGPGHYVVASPGACGVPAASGFVPMPASHCSAMGGNVASGPNAAGNVDCGVDLCGYGTTAGYAAAALGTCPATGVSAYVMALAGECHAMGGATAAGVPDGGWTTCQLELCPRTLESVCLQTQSGAYVGVAPDGSMSASSRVCGTNETFDIVGVRGELAQGQLATLRSRDGTYVRATADGVLSGRSHSLGDLELFAVQKSGTGPLALGELTCFRATSGKLVNAIGGGGGAMGATATACTGAEPIFRAVRSFPNISRGKYAQQSSDYGNVCNPTASKAIDGNRDSNWSACSVSSTNQDDRAYWQVDLLGTFDLKRIAIYNRTDCCSDRLQDFEVKTSLDGTSWSTMLNIPGEVGPLYQSDLGGTARFVRVELHRKNYLSLAEVEVFGLQVPNTPTLPRPSTSDASQSYVTDLVAVGGGSADVACPAGMVRIEQDLNEGAGGLFIYACVRYGARTEALANVGIDELYRENNSAQGRLDLNAGAGGRYLYFKLTPGPATTPIKDIAFTVWSTLPGAEGEICKWGNGWARAPNYPDPGIRQDVPAAAQGDLNLGAGGKYIYTCLLR